MTQCNKKMPASSAGGKFVPPIGETVGKVNHFRSVDPRSADVLRARRKVVPDPDHGTAAIIHSVIALGRALGMPVHAEGVETMEHHIFLRAAGCHHLQGYLFSRPLAAADMEFLLAGRTVRPAP
jgi:hypothetical protein